MAKLIDQHDDAHITDVERAVRAQEAQLPYLKNAAGFNQGTLENAVAHPRGDPGAVRLMGATKGELLPINEQ
jgi:hypothetical protein